MTLKPLKHSSDHYHLCRGECDSKCLTPLLTNLQKHQIPLPQKGKTLKVVQADNPAFPSVLSPAARSTAASTPETPLSCTQTPLSAMLSHHRLPTLSEAAEESDSLTPGPPSSNLADFRFDFDELLTLQTARECWDSDTHGKRCHDCKTPDDSRIQLTRQSVREYEVCRMSCHACQEPDDAIHLLQDCHSLSTRLNQLEAFIDTQRHTISQHLPDYLPMYRFVDGEAMKVTISKQATEDLLTVLDDIVAGHQIRISSTIEELNRGKPLSFGFAVRCTSHIARVKAFVNGWQDLSRRLEEHGKIHEQRSLFKRSPVGLTICRWICKLVTPKIDRNKLRSVRSIVSQQARARMPLD